MSLDLTSWIETSTLVAIEDFVARVTREGGPDLVPVADRVAVFDNYGTLWTEQPMPIQADFLLRRFGEMAAADPCLAERRPLMRTHRRWSAMVPSSDA